MTLNARYTVKDEVLDVNTLSSELESQRRRAESSSEDCSLEERKKVADMMQSVSDGINNSNTDEDEKRKANKQLKDLKILLDGIEQEKAMPQLIREFKSNVTELDEIIRDYADPKDKDDLKKQLDNIEQEGKIAIKEDNKALLIRINEQLGTLRDKAVLSNPQTWVHQFKRIASDGKFINEREAQYYITKGSRAIQEGDLEELKRCTNQLVMLLSDEDQKKMTLSGITR